MAPITVKGGDNGRHTSSEIKTVAKEDNRRNASSEPRKRWSTDEQMQYKTKIKSSSLKTVIYDPAVDGYQDLDQDSRFKQWFGARPLQIEKKHGIKAVKVIRQGLTQGDLKSVSEEDLEKITQEFKDKRGEGDRSVTEDFLKELAMKYGFTAGKL